MGHRVPESFLRRDHREPTPMATDSSTPNALLDAAERLLAERGLGVSLREITKAAGANLASVNYHFGSKTALIHAVIERRVAPMNEERARLLDSYVAAASPDAPALEQVLHALLAPAFRFGDDKSHDFAPTLSRLTFERDKEIAALLFESFKPTMERFFEVLGRCLPELPPKVLLSRLHFSVGAMAMTVSNNQAYRRMAAAAGNVPVERRERSLERLVNFLAAGFRAPVSTPGRGMR